MSTYFRKSQIYESKQFEILDNLPRHKCRWEVPDIKTLLECNSDMWYICREPKELISDFCSEIGTRLKTIEDSQYEITYFNDGDKWLYTIYRDKFLKW